MNGTWFIIRIAGPILEFSFPYGISCLERMVKMHGLVYLKNRTTGEVYNTKTKIHRLNSIDDLELCIADKFDKADWSKEPEESLDELYRKRCQQIRDMYDHVVFYFSGGSDSITALNSFVRNNIYLDEVVVYINSDTNDPKLSGDYAMSYLRKINYTGYVNVVDLNFQVLDRIVREETWRQYESYSGLLHSFQRFQITFFEDNGYVPFRERRGSIAHIFSTTFPLVARIKDSYFSKIKIVPFTMIAAAYYKNVLFFTDENMPEIFIKQSYIIGRYMKEKDISISNEYKEFKLLIRDEYNEEISPIKNGGSHQLKKKSDILSSQHMMLLRLYKENKDFIRKVLDISKEHSTFKLSLDAFSKKYELKLD